VVLEDAGLNVQLVSSSQARNLPGRPKTDKEDARWIARLTEMGLLRPASCRRRRSGRCGC
jgi:transposase